MKPEAALINTSRGPVIDEAALIRALTEKWISAAGLDVFEQEPIAPNNALLKLENVVVTPHIAGYSDEFWHNFWKHSVDTAIDMSQGRWPRSYVNPDASRAGSTCGRRRLNQTEVSGLAAIRPTCPS
jgi:D-3-phosphoglycerate dehydrogenase